MMVLSNGYHNVNVKVHIFHILGEILFNWFLDEISLLEEPGRPSHL